MQIQVFSVNSCAQIRKNTDIFRDVILLSVMKMPMGLTENGVRQKVGLNAQNNFRKLLHSYFFRDIIYVINQLRGDYD